MGACSVCYQCFNLVTMIIVLFMMQKCSVYVKSLDTVIWLALL